MMADKLIPIVSDPGEHATVDLIGGACAEALQFVQESWGLSAPKDCRIYVMTSWLRFVFQSAPWSWRILLAVTLPFWSFRARRTWPYSAAWTQRYGKRVAIGIKPPRLLAQSDKGFGVRLFVEEKDIRSMSGASRATNWCMLVPHICGCPPGSMKGSRR